MSLWEWAFVSLVVTSLAGMILFFGYTFRVRIMYPLAIVGVHLVLAILTTGLFAVATAQSMEKPHFPRYYLFVLIAMMVIMVTTLIIGLLFFFRFNLKKINIHGHFVGLHLTMASVAFIFATAATIAMTQTAPDKHLSVHPSLYNFYKHHRNIDKENRQGETK